MYLAASSGSKRTPKLQRPSRAMNLTSSVSSTCNAGSGARWSGRTESGSARISTKRALSTGWNHQSPRRLPRKYLPILSKLGMHLTQVATIDRGRDCRQPTSEMCAGSLLPSIADVGRLAPEKTVTTGPIGFRDASRTTARRGIRTLLRDSARWDHKILGLPESSAYPVQRISESLPRLVATDKAALPGTVPARVPGHPSNFWLRRPEGVSQALGMSQPAD